jgi:2-polyprenyl-6-methoxyphenol hydroxylase-like FAD-dependent oxidoreductase
MRTDLVALLKESLEPGTVIFNKELESLSVVDDSGPVTCRFRDGTHSSHDLVVGADGINSRVRSLLFDAPPKQFTGFRIFVLLDKAGHREKNGLPVGVPTLRLAPDKNAYILEFGCTCTDGSICDTIGVVFKTNEEVTDAWDHTVAIEGFRKRLLDFAKSDDDYLFDVLESAETAWDWGVYQHAPLMSWSALGGRVCLLGDSCHATAPFLGQGANMALQDAVCLARYLSTMTVPEAANAYEERRKPN